ncbi:nucleotide pyrophosphohydrolase [Candidatus Fermentibacteria bacterium]|nr:MAG: nucleotide pyrophosphohydrolase [Candidatus Fermentibacteria bacterium]
MKERTGRHSAPGYALRSVAAEERGRKSTLNREVFSLDNPGHLKQSMELEKKELEHAGEEIADVLLYLLNLADRLNVDPYEAAVRKMEINACKYPVDKCRGSRLKYNRLENETAKAEG